MAGLSDKVELDREDIRRLDQLGDRLGDTRPLMAAIGGFVRDVARGRFREQKGPDGKPTTLAAFKGKPVLVNLWATWCGPCIAELPTLEALAKRGTVRVAAISQDTQGADKVPAFLKAHGAPSLTPYVDDQMALSLGWNANLPTTVLFDSAGKEVWRWKGGNDWAGADAAKLIAEAK